jgi:DNA-binding GntR family transcriptional regulator
MIHEFPDNRDNNSPGDTLNQSQEIIRKMESLSNMPSPDNTESLKLDMLFHMVIVQSSGNQILIALYKHLSGLLFTSMVNLDKLSPNYDIGFIQLNHTKHVLETGPVED